MTREREVARLARQCGVRVVADAEGVQDVAAGVAFGDGTDIVVAPARHHHGREGLRVRRVLHGGRVLVRHLEVVGDGVGGGGGDVAAHHISVRPREFFHNLALGAVTLDVGVEEPHHVQAQEHAGEDQEFAHHSEDGDATTGLHVRGRVVRGLDVSGCAHGGSSVRDKAGASEGSADALWTAS
ncbi:hypothetical protein GCM10025876_19090 [Demequina litorisediminis]|uniref:Uncharacterized protein n=1 Tax=Demequina litorisediminis TaxID=1849022 RepID=A0ABQ6IDA8_9MICO|nr:hypothetical protein GCM10025876_19090 [Demequina litorisediminis]